MQEILEEPDPTPETVPEHPQHQVLRLLRRAFLDTQVGQLSPATTALDSATGALSHLLEFDPDNSPVPHRSAGFVRVILELYRDLLPSAEPVLPLAPLAHLLNILPDEVRTAIEPHPFYREFWIRTLAGTADVPLDYTPEVDAEIRYFQTEGREAFLTWLARSETYLPMIREVFREEGLPHDLIYMAMIESGFNPRAYSRARAAGLWQFARYTAPLYGLRSNTWVDERQDPEKATRAAVRHIHHLYELFEDWRLVVAAYNCGQGRLGNIIRQSDTRNFWELKGLPRETRQHVPRFMAAVIISKAPAWFGFENIAYGNPLSYDLVPVTECVDLRVAAECVGTTYGHMRQLNPELRLGYTPPSPARKVYPLRVPAGTADRFRDAYARIPEHRKTQMIDYQVRTGDTISEIARHLRVSTRAVMDANRIQDPRRLRAGTRLKIPVHPGTKEPARRPAQNRIVPDPARNTRHTYTVRPGDTLWEIARREDVSLEQLRAWNDLPASRTLYPGNQLTLWRPKNPALASAQPTEQTPADRLYTVRPGDTLWEIARTFGTSVETLKQWNGIRHASRLRAGARLIVLPSGAPQVD